MESKFEDVERIYMEQEKEHIYKNRVKSGGNKKLKYTEAWVEFKNKKVAKTCAAMLNNVRIGGKKRHNLFYDDIWNIKYLSKFKWSHLTEKLQYDQKMREQRLKNEMGIAKKEQSFYEEKRTLSKKLEKIEEKRTKDITKMDQKIQGTED